MKLMHKVIKWGMAVACTVNMLPVSVFAEETEPAEPSVVSITDDDAVLETEEDGEGFVIAAPTPAPNETPEDEITADPSEKTEEETPKEDEPPVITEEEDTPDSEITEDVEEDEDLFDSEEIEEIIEGVDKTDEFIEAELDKHAGFVSMKLKVSRVFAVEVFTDLGKDVGADDYLLVNVGGEERHYMVADAAEAYSTSAGRTCTKFTIRLNVRQIDDAMTMSLVVDGTPGREVHVSVADYANTVLGASYGAEARFLRAMLNFGRRSSFCKDTDVEMINAAKEYIEAVKEYRSEQ